MALTTLPSISISTSNAKRGDAPKDEHTHQRVFIGPMPEKVVSQTEARASKHMKRRLFRSSTHDEEDDDVSQVIKGTAFHFFLREGGKPEDWGENEEQSTREEMLQRWRNSEWGAIWSGRRKKEIRQTSRWVGGSFEIGRFLGVNIIQQAEGTRDTSSNATRKRSLSGSRMSIGTDARLSMGRETYVTAPSHLPPSISRKSDARNRDSGVSESMDDTTPTSSTALIRPHLAEIDKPNGVKAQTEIIPRPIIRAPSVTALSDDGLQFQGKGKGRLVHYADISDHEEPGPAPPSEVLERTGVAVEETSAGASTTPDLSTFSPKLDLEWGDVVMRDRMLVRSCYTKSEIISPQFNEIRNRTTRNLQYADWAEYMVAWRKDRIEIYRDHDLPGKEWVIGHKHLAFVIPLKSSKTQLSLYSFVDLTFCITCPPTTTRKDSKSRWFFSRTKEGTNIFIFKLKSRSRAYDWTWQLWRQMGGELPSTIEVRNPRMDTKVKIDIPISDNARRSRVFSRENVIRLCMDSLRTIGDWNIIEQQMSEGKTLELAWRVDTTLDWIWLEDDIYGDPRPSAVLCGLALKQPMRPAVLEIRLAEHYPAYIHLRNGNRLHEPPAIEGYLERVKPNSQTKQSIYLATHDGNLFTLSPNRCHPPSPPGLAPGIKDIESFGHALRQTEAQRGAMQCMDATGVMDLRSIVLIRRAFHITPEPTHDQTKNGTNGSQDQTKKGQEDDVWFEIWSQPEERKQGDDDDEGGEEYLAKCEDKPGLRMHRSFELLLKSGRVIRFEAYSRRVAVEWIERLRALVLYWKQRHRIDAKEEMDVAQARRPRLTPLTRVFQDELPPEPPADISAPLPALGSLYNWCVLDGCKPIIRGGKVYMRRGMYGQYKLVQLFLVAGHLVQFRIVPKSSLHLSMRKQTNLIDAYVCSGYFAALALPKGQYRANANAAPRRYQDGLEADDPEEDMLFMVWYRPQVSMSEKGTIDNSGSIKPDVLRNVHALSAKRKLLVFRTRSKLERDAWCWALNCEIEKVVRAQKGREEKLRETGSLMKI